MLLWTIVRVALASLLGQKLRSFLAMLGIIIGVASVVSMLALAEGARREVMDRVAAMGTDLLVVRPGQRGLRGVMSGSFATLTLDDAHAIVAGVPGVAEVAPVVRGSSQVKYFNQNRRTSLIGTAITYFTARNFAVAQGRPFTEREVERRARVAVLGPDTASFLFGTTDPLGEPIKIDGVSFRVVGVLEAKGDQGWYNPDDQVIVPHSTAMQLLLGLDALQEIDIRAVPGADLMTVQEDVSTVLRRRHRIPPGDDDDFNIRNQAEITETYTEISRTFTFLLGGIASISLLVGGIGIMNIMLVTVVERTREIGVRKAIGAKDRDILRQFLLEAVLMSGLGGVLGLLMGFCGATVIQFFSRFDPVVRPGNALLALCFAAAVGIFFGYYPARRAAQLNPIDALRYE